jgi:hypothetical protein
MKIIQFIETCEVLVTSEYDVLDGDYSNFRTFLSGEQETVEEVMDFGDDKSQVEFSDGKVAIIPTDYFILMDLEDNNVDETW